MLSTPPAFILSQDQTLKKCVCSKFNINLLAYISLFTVLKDLSIVLWMCPSFRTVLSKNFRGLYLCVSLFSYQGSRLCCSLETACLLYHSCLPLSRTFLKFLKLFLKLFCDSQTNISHRMCDVNTYFSFFQKNKNGEGGIWTLAPRKRSIPLAGAPLQPLEYFSWRLNIKSIFNLSLSWHID